MKESVPEAGPARRGERRAGPRACSLLLLLIGDARTYGAKRESELEEPDLDIDGACSPLEISSAPVKLPMLSPRRRFWRIRDLLRGKRINKSSTSSPEEQQLTHSSSF